MTSSLIPVFVFPDGLQFSRAIRRRTLCLYNPYDFGIKFQSKRQKTTKTQFIAFSHSFGHKSGGFRSELVFRNGSLATRPRYVCLVGEEGFCLIFVYRVVRLRETTLTRAKLLLSVVEHSSGQRSGERQIDVTISEHDDDSPPAKVAFAPCVQSGAGVAESRQMAPKEKSSQAQTLALAVVCLCVLLVPHDGDHWLRVGVTQKLVVSGGTQFPSKSVFTGGLRFGSFDVCFAPKLT